MPERVRLLREASPYVLPTESPAELEQLKRAVREALNPPDSIGEIYADEFAYCVWLARRFQRASSQGVKKHFGDALFDILRELDACERDEAAELVDSWSRDEPTAKAEIRAILQKYGKSEYDVEAEAIRRCLNNLTAIEQLRTSSDLGRDKALTMFAFVQDKWAKNQRAAKGAVADHPVVGLAHSKRKAG
ncbi:hypothetical protein [Bradyrhizobium sp. AUGA SZCCT0182]|uniref:hypothetical protein n=1 Tax=Bradyrhizobium sp. AUGA SZCCT0182 TaxID=2807667 RepID=UPI001BA66CF0|nr:hypothetical protein [Bradyrhizobium sp. AUGA SZCCT0182]MBR1232811.1 hypothetical protein [Bradyrhizobium sp. AUGA SZCCT0182]